MNVFSHLVAEGDISETPGKAPDKFQIDDNIGESVHIHYRNVRLEFSIDDYIAFANELEKATERLDDGNC